MLEYIFFHNLSSMYVFFYSNFIHVDACSSRHLLCKTLKQASIENIGHETAFCWNIGFYRITFCHSHQCKLSFAYLFLHIDLKHRCRGEFYNYSYREYLIKVYQARLLGTLADIARLAEIQRVLGECILISSLSGKALRTLVDIARLAERFNMRFQSRAW